MFTVFIADIKHCFKYSYILLYADDMKVHKAVRSLSDTYKLQDDLKRFAAYCTPSKLQLNVPKCFHIMCTRQKSIITTGTQSEIN